MKKIILFLITTTTLTHISYASFPVNQDLQTESVEPIVSPSHGNSPPVLGILSLLLSVFGLILFTTSYVGIGVVLILFAIIFGLIGLFVKRSRMLSITGILLSVISIVIGLIRFIAAAAGSLG